MQQQKVNKIARKIGRLLELSGAKMIQSAFSISTTTKSKAQLKELLKANGIEKGSFYDAEYSFISLAKWKQIIITDWVDVKKYHSDNFDCDNFAFLFSARMASLFRINSCGVATGLMRIGSRSVRHAFSLIVADDKLYIMESQTDAIGEYKKEGTIVGGSVYTIDWVSFF